ncbi:fluoride efflux transporter CrcB [Tomitella biformata]|uniref:fluoride efflux transporter CrcB n=1 Tax=Tomitella biformata TaxID=630403 RepID=UPI000465F7FD|nr:fluoride efflux transporter CrcB [Tomitella biformata]
MTALWLACAGSAGAVARFMLDGAVRARWRPDFPWATIAVNVSGSLLLGIITGLALWHGEPSQVRAIIGVGFCGGYTTFSTASVETVRLLQRGRYWAGAGNAFGTLAVTVAAAAVGLTLASL